MVNSSLLSFYCRPAGASASHERKYFYCAQDRYDSKDSYTSKERIKANYRIFRAHYSYKVVHDERNIIYIYKIYTHLLQERKTHIFTHQTIFLSEVSILFIYSFIFS